MFLYLAGLGLYTESVAMLEDLPAYGERISELVDHVTTKLEGFEKAMYQTLIPKRLQERAQPLPETPASGARGKKKPATPPAQQQQQPPAIPEVRVRPEPTPLV